MEVFDDILYLDLSLLAERVILQNFRPCGPLMSCRKVFEQEEPNFERTD